jgi:catechol 2,3-dioxygenase-like lactoylglutathione lyase family enzyme
MSYRILRTNHTSFTVTDLTSTVSFFVDCMGFELTSRARRDPRLIEIIVGVPGADIEVAYLAGPGHVVELIQYLGPPDRTKAKMRPCDAGFAHLAFDVTGIDDLLAAASKHGFRPLSPPIVTGSGGPNAGKRVSYMRNEDGVTLELIEDQAK